MGMATKKTSPINPIYLDINTARERISDLERTIKRLHSDIHGDEKSQQYYGEAMAKQEDTETEWVEVERKQAAGLEKRVEVLEKLVSYDPAGEQRRDITRCENRLESMESYLFWGVLVACGIAVVALVVVLDAL